MSITAGGHTGVGAPLPQGSRGRTGGRRTVGRRGNVLRRRKRCGFARSADEEGRLASLKARDGHGASWRRLRGQSRGRGHVHDRQPALCLSRCWRRPEGARRGRAAGTAIVVAEGGENSTDAVIGEGHDDSARNTTILQMLKTRDLIVCLSRDVCSPRETSSLPLSYGNFVCPSTISLSHRSLACTIPLSLGLSFCQKSGKSALFRSAPPPSSMVSFFRV